MRPSLDTAMLDVVDADARGIGDLVVTTLSNEYMPLLRYRIGDLCSRTVQSYRTAYVIHGRAADAFHIAAGRRVTVRTSTRRSPGPRGLHTTRSRRKTALLR